MARMLNRNIFSGSRYARDFAGKMKVFLHFGVGHFGAVPVAHFVEFGRGMVSRKAHRDTKWERASSPQRRGHGAEKKPHAKAAKSAKWEGSFAGQREQSPGHKSTACREGRARCAYGGCRRGRAGRGVRSLLSARLAHGSTDGPSETSGNGLPLSWREFTRWRAGGQMGSGRFWRYYLPPRACT